MKKIVPILFVAMFVFSGVLLAQTYPLMTIEEIQYQHPDSLLANGDDQDRHNPFFGDTVRVRGVVMVRPVVDPSTDRRRVYAAGGRWMTYFVDPDGQQYDGYDGIIPIQHDTTDENQSTFYDLVDTADVVEFTVVIEEFFTTTQAALLLNPVTPVNVISNLGQRPAPVELTISDFVDDQGIWDPLSEKYEGMYVIIRNVTSSDRDLNNGTFRINDGQGNSMLMYDQSGFFTTRDHRLTGITDYQPPVDGSNISYIRGFIQTHSDLGARIAPAYPGDIEISASAPAISNVSRDSAEVMSNQAVEISSTIIDSDGSVDSVKLFYRVDNGSYNFVEMFSGGNDIFTGTIPGMASDSALVDYYIWSKDNDGNESTVPSDINSPEYFYLVLNRNVIVQDIQYNPFGTDISGYDGFEVSLRGIVTADTSDIEGTETGTLLGPQVYIQNGSGPWSGVNIFGTETLLLQRGDDVTVTGTVGESFLVTQISGLDDPASVQVHTTGNALPDPSPVSTDNINNLMSGDVDAEEWEGVLIKYMNVIVMDENADGEPGPDQGSGSNRNYGDILVADASTNATRVGLQFGTHQYHNYWFDILLTNPIRINMDDTFDGIAGILWYGFGAYKLMPRKDDDFVGHITDIDDAVELPTEYSISQNYPNPFNPSTSIEYSLPQAGNVTLNIYNLLGQRVRTILDNVPQSAGTHKVIFNASELPSGIYFYSFKTNDFVQVKKMILLR